MNPVPGTTGYETAIDAFAEASLGLDFAEVNADFLEFLPGSSARVLDAGAGVGQNSAALCKRGYSVVAVEPLPEFLRIAKSEFKELEIEWVNDSLPKLETLDRKPAGFDFILLDAVWHHLDYQERRLCIRRFSELINLQGVCAISMRNGPAGAGRHIFPTDCLELFKYSREYGFKVIFHVENQPSKMKHKPDVVWSRVALQKV